MMNLEKMKQKKRTITKSRVKKGLLAATTFLCLTTPLLQTQTAYAAENTTLTDSDYNQRYIFNILLFFTME